MNMTLAEILDNVYFVDYMADIYEMNLTDLYDLSLVDLVEFYEEWSAETCYLDMT